MLSFSPALCQLCSGQLYKEAIEPPGYKVSINRESLLSLLVFSPHSAERSLALHHCSYLWTKSKDSQPDVKITQLTKGNLGLDSDVSGFRDSLSNP